MSSPSLRLHARRRAVRRNALAVAVALGLTVCGAVAQIGSAGGDTLLHTIDAAAQDTVLRARPAASYLAVNSSTASADPRSFITIVAIDERTLAELGAYNGGYPRSYHAQVIENLLAAPPRVIALDVGFFEPTADDAVLAAALDEARKLPVRTAVILAGVGVSPDSQSSTSSGSGELIFDRALEPVPRLADRASQALANVWPDEHGTIRSMPLLADVHGVERPTLGLAAMASYLRRPGFVDGRPDGSTVQLAGRNFPVDARTALRINFFGPPSRPYQTDATFRVVSFVDVLRGRIDPNIWRGGLVLVGALGATGLADDYWTPVSDQARKMAGVEIHANVAATVFSSQFVRETSQPVQVALIFGLAMVLALLGANFRLVVSGILGPLTMLAFAMASAWSLYAQGWLTPFGAPLLVGCASFVTLIVRRLVAERWYAARHDGLSGLPNRARLAEHLATAIGVARGDGSTICLLVLGLDRLKDVSDTLGRLAGDALLRAVAERLRGVVPGASALARLGGDEFGVLLRGTDAAAASQLSLALVQALAGPFKIGAHEVSVAPSVGLALYPAHGDETDTLLRRASLALYAAKHSHAGLTVYTAELDHDSAERLALIGALPRAVERGELVLYCQPKVDCRSGALAGVEALVRWQHPERGLIAPERFIRLAEEAGVIGALTGWVLGAAVRQVSEWLAVGLVIPMAVNLSAQDFDDPALVDAVADLLARSHVPAWLLSVEITETAILANPERAIAVISRLADLGVRTSLDDFGTGYASLTAIRDLPLYELKIDRSFICEMGLVLRDQVIVRSTIELGHSLGLSVVAEGVEDEATFDVLRRLGCDVAQGYLFARPMPANQLKGWIQASGIAPVGPITVH